MTRYRALPPMHLACALAGFVSVEALYGAIRSPDLLLVTLDTTRADALGVYGEGARTPEFDRLAASGVRFEEALAAVPLTLPSHASLFTGLDPIEHGLRDNGQGRLASVVPTLAEALQRRGYATAGIVASRVLDRRFGLDRGFDLYDEAMAAERLGEFGYPERPANEVVDAALAWDRLADPAKPHFLWVHFYDPHAPYAPPGDAEGSHRDRYRAEVQAVDREVARLVAGLRVGAEPASSRWIAVVGDHGEALGEQGEREHGLLLSRGVLRVPLFLAGPGIAPGGVVSGPVATRRLAATLLQLVDRYLGAKPAGRASGSLRRDPAALPGEPLPLRGGTAAAEPVFHETVFPLTAFGWGALFGVTEGDLRFVLGPRPRLVDWRADPAEAKPLAIDGDSRGRALYRDLKRAVARAPVAPPEEVANDADLAQALQSLGYLSGQSGTSPRGPAESAGRLDPRAGLELLDRFGAAKEQLARGDVAGALAAFVRLTQESPASVPFWMERSAAERASGNLSAAISSLERARALHAEFDFLDLRLGEAYAAAGRKVEAEAAWRRALARNPRFAQAAFALGEWLQRQGRAADEEAVVRAAVEAGASSVFLLARLAQIELARGELANADRHLEEAIRLLPEFSTAWRLWAEVARRQGDLAAAASRAARAAALE